MFKASLWLLVFMIFGMILLGGFTRLTGSGLSIVEWQPLMGIFPPLNEADWVSLFQKYQTSPEYQKVNLGMTLEEFQSIFWLEFIHRLWGRAIGVVLLLPIIMSFMKLELRSYRVPLIILSLLVAGQGVMGWYMVASGLIDNPHVSPYRLTAHLLLGVLILGLALLIAMKKTCPEEVYLGYSRKSLRKLSIGTFISFGCICLTILYGGLVAGHKAGLIYNTYPLMGGNFFPSDLFFLPSFWENVFENSTTVQFIHRWMGTLTAILIFVLGLGFWNGDLPPRIKIIMKVLTGMAVLQFSLGLLTLLLVVPCELALTHQAGALVLFILNLAVLQKTLPIWCR